MLGMVYDKKAYAVAGRVELIQHVYLQRSSASLQHWSLPQVHIARTGDNAPDHGVYDAD